MIFNPLSVLATIALVVWLAHVASRTSHRIRRANDELARRKGRRA